MASRIVSELAFPHEVAAELRVPTSTVKTWLRTGKMPGVKLANGEWRIDWADVSALKTRRTVGAHHRAADRPRPGERMNPV